MAKLIPFTKAEIASVAPGKSITIDDPSSGRMLSLYRSKQDFDRYSLSMTGRGVPDDLPPVTVMRPEINKTAHAMLDANAFGV